MSLPEFAHLAAKAMLSRFTTRFTSSLTAGRFQQDSTDAWRGLMSAGIGPLQSGPRDDLDAHVRDLEARHNTLQPFPHDVARVNRGMGVSTAAVLPHRKVEQYKDLTAKVQDGKMLNSTAYFQSASEWWHIGNIPAAALNFAGMLKAVPRDVANTFKEI